jgi:pyruvate/oxaloacetate carboxyltransferase
VPQCRVRVYGVAVLAQAAGSMEHAEAIAETIMQKVTNFAEAKDETDILSFLVSPDVANSFVKNAPKQAKATDLDTEDPEKWKKSKRNSASVMASG